LVTGDGRNVVTRAGSRVSCDLADELGLTDGLSVAMAPTKQRRRGHDRGRVLVDLAVMLAEGGEAISDLAMLRDQGRLFSDVASVPTAWRTLEAIDEDALARVATARAGARAAARSRPATSARQNVTRTQAVLRGSGTSVAPKDRVARRRAHTVSRESSGPYDAGMPETGSPAPVVDWNVVVTVRDGSYNRVRRALAGIGPTHETDHYNVLAMSTDDVPTFLEDVSRLFEDDPSLAGEIARVLPLVRTFDFGDAADFERRVAEIAEAWLPALAGRSFHVRLHRRGVPEVVSARDAEQALDRVLLAALDEAGTPGSIAFDDPDAVVDVETLGYRGGVSLWTRQDLERYPFLRID
jgi:tRNA(Ser,Leu) C12 N-acetylase TAN1